MVLFLAGYMFCAFMPSRYIGTTYFNYVLNLYHCTMATIYKHICKKCNYTEMVSGGKDANMSGYTRTMVCLNCNRLYDAQKFIMDDPEADPYSKCDYCKTKKHKIWSQKKMPCPKCDHKMEIKYDGSAYLSD